MGIDDPLLPAAAHLTGELAADVLRPAIEHVGGRLVASRCSQVHYRPGHDLIARYRTEIDWGNGRPRRETLYVGTTRDGAPPGTIAVTASAAGTDLVAGVWRWPFDPALPALERVATSATSVLRDHALLAPGATPTTTVVAYRPTERAVLRIDAGDQTWFAKLVRPDQADALVRRHELLGRHELPVPRVAGHDPEAGLVVLEELSGPTLRDLVKSDEQRWVAPNRFADLVRRLRSVPPDGLVAMRRRLADGPHHVALLSKVLPSERARLGRLEERIRRASDDRERRRPEFVHGDLHERQLVVDDGRIVGVLDIDECGIGDAIDDIAVPIAHLRYRALTAPNGERLHRYADELTAVLADELPPDDTAVGAAAVLAGLATGPFRSQTPGWQQQVTTVLDLIDHVAGID